MIVVQAIKAPMRCGVPGRALGGLIIDFGIMAREAGVFQSERSTRKIVIGNPRFEVSPSVMHAWVYLHSAVSAADDSQRRAARVAHM
jgi:hypothetical protein